MTINMTVQLPDNSTAQMDVCSSLPHRQNCVLVRLPGLLTVQLFTHPAANCLAVKQSTCLTVLLLGCPSDCPIVTPSTFLFRQPAAVVCLPRCATLGLSDYATNSMFQWLCLSTGQISFFLAVRLSWGIFCCLASFLTLPFPKCLTLQLSSCKSGCKSDPPNGG